MDRQNVILITIDSFRADALSHMENLSSLEDESIFRSIIYTNGPSTPFSFPSLFNIDYHPFFDKPKITSPTIVEKFRGNGYQTLGVVANNPYISSLTGYDKGYSHFEDYMSSLDSSRRSTTSKILDRCPSSIQDLKNIYKWYFKKDITSARGGELAVNDAKDMIEDERPFFLWLHLMDAHYPYTPPISQTEISPFQIAKLNNFRKKYRLTNPGKEDQLIDLKELYYDCVRYVDKQIMSLIGFLKENEMWKETDLIITADHGEGFYEHGFLGHPAQLYEELVRVPLIVKMDGLEQNRKENIRELRDIPVLLNSTIEDQEGNLEEENRTIPLKASHAGDRSCMKGDINLIGDPGKLNYDIFGLVTDRYKLIYDEETSQIELYDLIKDPEERKDISKRKRKTVKDLLKDEYPFP